MVEFIKDFNKKTDKQDGVSYSAPKPKFWISTGSYIINKVISGSYLKGIAQGKLAMLAGPSAAGKSFVTGNIIKAAQDGNFGIMLVDSENAQDETFLGNLGVDVTRDDFIYRGVSTINQASNQISKFLKSYRAAKSEHPFLIVVDSLDMLQTESAMNAYDSGEIKGDQGQHAKQLKTFLSPLMHDIKDLNIAILCTKQVYLTQDPIEAKNPATQYKLTESIRYPFSQIALITKLMLKNDATKKYEGIRLKVFGYKTRFTKPFQQAVIEVPYDEGMDPYNGILDAGVALGIITQAGAWYTFNGKKFQSKNFNDIKDAVLKELVRLEDEQGTKNVLDVKLSNDVVEVEDEA